MRLRVRHCHLAPLPQHRQVRSRNALEETGPPKTYRGSRTLPESTQRRAKASPRRSHYIPHNHLRSVANLEAAKSAISSFVFMSTRIVILPPNHWRQSRHATAKSAVMKLPFWHRLFTNSYSLPFNPLQIVGFKPCYLNHLIYCLGVIPKAATFTSAATKKLTTLRQLSNWFQRATANLKAASSSGVCTPSL